MGKYYVDKKSMEGLKIHINRANFFVFMVIGLIVSITPSSAALIHESNVSDDNIADLNNILNVVESDMGEIQGYSDSLNGDLECIKKRAGDYDWKFWKWSDITHDIMGTLNHLISTAEKMGSPADRLKENAKKLDESAALLNSTKDANYSDFSDDASQMAELLGKHFNSTFRVENISALEVRKGDIVQYISQGKYPQYLKVVDIIYLTNNNQTITQTSNNRKRSQNNPGDVTPILILGGMGSVLVKQELSQYSQLKTDNNLNPDVVEEEVFQEQQNKINKNQEKVNNLDTHVNNLKKSATAFGILSAICTGLSALSVVVWGVMVFVGVLTVDPVVVGAAFSMLYFTGVCLVVAGVSAVVAMSLIGVRAILNSIHDSLSDKIKPAQTDLETYYQSNNTDMDISAFDGVPIVEQPFDWENYESLDTPRAQHGDVIMGPGIQFLYGPKEGYTGKDNFRIYATSKTSLFIKKINVNIIIKPIPQLILQKGDNR